MATAYTWNALRFLVPDGMVDQTVVTFVDNPGQPGFQLTVTADGRGAQAFDAFVDAQLVELARSLPGYASVSRSDQTVNGRAAVVVEHRARAPQGPTLRQRQAYLDRGALVATVTLTVADRAGPAELGRRADDAFASLLASID